MSNTRRTFSTEYKVEAAHRVIDSGRTSTEVAQELSLNEGSRRARIGYEKEDPSRPREFFRTSKWS